MLVNIRVSYSRISVAIGRSSPTVPMDMSFATTPDTRFRIPKTTQLQLSELRISSEDWGFVIETDDQKDLMVAWTSVISPIDVHVRSAHWTRHRWRILTTTMMVSQWRSRRPVIFVMLLIPMSRNYSQSYYWRISPTVEAFETSARCLRSGANTMFPNRIAQLFVDSTSPFPSHESLVEIGIVSLVDYQSVVALNWKKMMVRRWTWR